MKKTFAYATIAAFLGVAIMLAPFLMIQNPTLVPTSADERNTYGVTPESLAPANTQAAAKQSESAAGIAPNYPVDILTVAFILLISLAAAFTVSFYIRRNRSFRSEKALLPT
jgi:hypothetical protein